MNDRIFLYLHSVDLRDVYCEDQNTKTALNLCPIGVLERVYTIALLHVTYVSLEYERISEEMIRFTHLHRFLLYVKQPRMTDYFASGVDFQKESQISGIFYCKKPIFDHY